MLNLLFGDRYWTLKLALAAGLFALLCNRARRDFGEDRPRVEKAAVYFETMKGRTIHLWSKRVVAAAPDGFDVGTDVGPFRVISPERPAVGERVSLLGRVTGPRTIEAVAFQANAGVRWKRPLGYAASAAALVLFLLWARRRFRWPLREGLFRSRT